MHFYHVTEYNQKRQILDLRGKGMEKKRLQRTHYPILKAQLFSRQLQKFYNALKVCAFVRTFIAKSVFWGFPH